MSHAWLIHTEDDDPDMIQYNIEIAEWFADYRTDHEEPMEPLTSYKYPLIDNAAKILNQQDGYVIEDNRVVALLVAEVYWRDALKDILPDGSDGIVAVFENDCNPTFTFHIDGSSAHFVGAGDNHDEAYSSLGVFARINDLSRLAMRESMYKGRPVNEDHCPFNITVYPSFEMESRFVTDKPKQYTIGAILIFAFTSVVFILYDHWWH